MKKIIRYIKTNNVKSIIGLGVILSLLVVIISFSLADPTPNYSFVYNSTGTNNNYSNNDPGSFSLNKSVEWIGHNKLKVTMTINSKPMINSTGNDILLVVDTSSFLDNTMLTDLKNSLTSAASVITTNNSNSRIGILSFSNSYTKYNFTNNLTTINSNINNLSVGGGRSYYEAFMGIDDILASRNTNSGLIVIFITTGLSNLNKAGDLYRYEQLVDKYNIDMRGIYYLSNKVLTQPNTYFNSEIVASKDTLEVGIETLANDYEPYTNFTVKDYYDTTKFSLVGNLSSYNESSSYTNYGNLEVTSAGEIDWIMESSDYRPFFTGTTAKLEYELNYTGGAGNYNLSNHSVNVIKTINQTTNNFSVTDSIVIGNNYSVTYVANAPTGCSASGSFGSTHKDVYEVVQYPSDPTCTGYKFKGWKVTTQGVNTSKNGFVMPESNVEVKAIWSKIDITKSMAGDVYQPRFLYNVLKDEAESGGVAKDYDTYFSGKGFSHQDSYNGTGNKKVYFYRADNDDQASTIYDKNNVIFANFCWQMLRTTDTGGIKMIYNGVPVVGDSGHEECQRNRGTSVGYVTTSSDTLTFSPGTIYFGSDYTYDATNNEFSLSGTITTSSSWANNYNNLIGKYTCNGSTRTKTCTTLYLIESYNSSTTANILRVQWRGGNNLSYSFYGYVRYNLKTSSPADVGYMYNTRYEVASKSLGTTSYYFGSGYDYRLNQSTGQYEYFLTGEVAKDYSGNITSTHYTCWSQTQGGSCSSISYVNYHASSNKTMYYLSFSGGKGISDVLGEMLNASNVNKYDSTLKFATDKWYEHYILPYPSFTSKLENVVYCNDRSIKNLGGWSPTGSQNANLQFNNSSIANNLNCSNATDRFSADSGNTIAHLKYPVGYLSAPEANLLNSARNTGTYYFLISPHQFTPYRAFNQVVGSTGAFTTQETNESEGVRPVISLKAGTTYTSGDGSMTEPYRLD